MNWRNSGENCFHRAISLWWQINNPTNSLLRDFIFEIQRVLQMQPQPELSETE